MLFTPSWLYDLFEYGNGTTHYYSGGDHYMMSMGNVLAVVSTVGFTTANSFVYYYTYNISTGVIKYVRINAAGTQSSSSRLSFTSLFNPYMGDKYSSFQVGGVNKILTGSLDSPTLWSQTTYTQMLLMSPNGTYLYAYAYSSGTVTLRRLNTTTGAVIATYTTSFSGNVSIDYPMFADNSGGVVLMARLSSTTLYDSAIYWNPITGLNNPLSVAIPMMDCGGLNLTNGYGSVRAFVYNNMWYIPTTSYSYSTGVWTMKVYRMSANSYTPSLYKTITYSGIATVTTTANSNLYINWRSGNFFVNIGGRVYGFGNIVDSSTTLSNTRVIVSAANGDEYGKTLINASVYNEVIILNSILYDLRSTPIKQYKIANMKDIVSVVVLQNNAVLSGIPKSSNSLEIVAKQIPPALFPIG